VKLFLGEGLLPVTFALPEEGRLLLEVTFLAPEPRRLARVEELVGLGAVEALTRLERVADVVIRRPRRLVR